MRLRDLAPVSAAAFATKRPHLTPASAAAATKRQAVNLLPWVEALMGKTRRVQTSSSRSKVGEPRADRSLVVSAGFLIGGKRNAKDQSKEEKANGLQTNRRGSSGQFTSKIIPGEGAYAQVIFQKSDRLVRKDSRSYLRSFVAGSWGSLRSRGWYSRPSDTTSSAVYFNGIYTGK